MTTDKLEIWLKENNLITTPEDHALFANATEGLLPHGHFGVDSVGQPIMCGTGAHCFRSFSDAITLSKARSVFEIGLNLGHGSAVMLALGVESVYSIDISKRAETASAAIVISKRYPGRFRFECISSSELSHSERPMADFDFAFVDGGHEIADVRNDLWLCRNLGIKNILFDDWYPEYGPGVQSMIKVCGLKVRAIFGNMCLCCDT